MPCTAIFKVEVHLVAPTRFELIRQPLAEVVQWLLFFGGMHRTTDKPSRNELIRKRHTAGEHLSDLAREFGISPQRVYQIVRFKSK